MKQRQGFVSNSSSSSFILTNLLEGNKVLLDFVRDNPELLEGYAKDCFNDYTQRDIELDAAKYVTIFPPGEEVRCYFSNEVDSKAEEMLRHMLEIGGNKEINGWRWEFEWNDQAGDPFDYE